MRLLVVAIATALLVNLAGCQKREASDVMTTDAKDGAVYATTECVAAHPDGPPRCNKKTCKKDAASDCSDFAANCIKHGHHYAGTADGGACSRVL